MSEHEFAIRSNRLESSDHVYSNKYTPKNEIHFHDVGQFNQFVVPEIRDEPMVLFQLNVIQHATTVYYWR